MLLKVKHEELDGVQKTMVKDGDSYDTEIDNILKQLDILKTIWQGQDSDIFMKHVVGYVEKMKNIPIALRNMSKFVDKANKGYTEKDEEFSKDLQKEATNYDEQSSNNG